MQAGKSEVLVVRREGGSRVIAVTRLLPSDWECVRIIPDLSAEETDLIRLDVICMKRTEGNKGA